MKKRILAFIMTFLMVIMLLPSLAFAGDEKAAGGGTATLTIINGVDDWGGGPVVLVNEKFQFEEGDTLGDLFQAAKDGGALEDFEFKGQYINSITPVGGSAVANASDWSYYWSTYKNGEYVQGPTDGTETDLLTDGVCFQFAVEAYPPNKEPSADEWAELQEDTYPIDSVAGEGETVGSATVMIIKGYGSAGPIALINDEIEFAEGATLEDAFDALVEEEELDEYSATEYGFLKSITWYGMEYTQPEDYSSYWACYKNEGYASGTDCTMGDALTDGTRFEFVWLDYPSKVGLSSEAWAELSAKAEMHKKTATLTIIKGVDSMSGEPVVIVNKKYEFEKGAALKDLFQAAVDAGDLDAYEFKGGYIDSITAPGASTMANVFDMYTYYWANYKNGEYAQGYTDCTETDLLTDGVCFQFSYEAYPENVTPTDAQWADILDSTYPIDSVAGEGEAAGTVSVIIVRGSDGDKVPFTLINDEIDFAEGATLKDAFDAIVEEGDLDDYAFDDYGYLNSITWFTYVLAQPADYSSYWAIYKNEAYVSGATDGTAGDPLTDGTRFEFVWTDYPNKIGLSTEAWMALSALAEAGSGAAHGPIYPSPADGTAEVAKEADFNKDFSELYENFIEMGTGSSSWMAMCSIAAGKTGAGDLNVALAQAEEAFNTPSGSNLQKSILILTALGVDVTAVEFEEGSPVNLLEKVAKTPTAVGAWAESPAYSLLAFGANPDYGVDRSFVNNPDKLIEKLAGYQVPDGTFGWNGQTGSPDSTGAALAALSCYMDNEQTAEMIAAALEGLKAYQNEDGGFGWEAGADTSVDSTAQVIIGLCAVGIDPTGAEWTKGENNPVTALMTFANADNTDIKDMPGMDVDYARDDMFRAMAAFAGLRKTGAAYNVYTRASEGEAQFDVAYLNQNELAIPVDTTTQLEFVVKPATDSLSITWSSSDPAVASVDETGKVTALHTGKAEITAVSDDGLYSGTCEVTVLFKDVTDSSKYWFNPVYWAAERGITNGYQTEADRENGKYGTFGTEENCTRGQLMVFLWRMAGKPSVSGVTNPFSDVKKSALGSTYYNAILWGYSTGITKGYKENGKQYFKPNEPIARKDIMIMIYRFADKPTWSFNADRPESGFNFTDVKGKYSVTSDTYNAIAWAYTMAITNGYKKQTAELTQAGLKAPCFGCILNCKRKDIVTFLYRYYNTLR
ncbi:MAG: S-layer homology domain-containing protein [Lachnospiraceae bacterium]|nr:S-layer homology domain-containing protein [Lachnospiraceae bacterium]